MRNSFLHLVLAVITLVLGGGLEELLPKPAGVGFPILLMAAAFFAGRLHPFAAVLFALAAGGMEDALSSLPLLTSASFFCVFVVLVRRLDLPPVTFVFAYPIYQIWLRIWMPMLAGGIFVRLLLALPVGFLTWWIVRMILSWVWERASLDEQD